MVIEDPQGFQFGEVAQFGRYLTAQLVLVERQELQVGKTGQSGRYLAAQLVVAERERFQVGEACQFGGYLSAQLVFMESQRYQVGEVAQFGRQLTAQAIDAEVQFRHTPTGVGGDAAPFAQGLVTQPIGIVAPVVAVGGVVEGCQRVPVGGLDLFGY